MSLSTDDVKKIAHLARLNFSAKDTEQFAKQLSHILDFVEQMNNADTAGMEACAHSIDIEQRLRTDVVTEPDQREAFQAIAPLVEAGLYLVPKVIDAE